MPHILIAQTDHHIAACFDAMSELRPQLQRAQFVSRVRELQRTTGFNLAYLVLDDQVQSVAGYRISDWLVGGRYLEVEDLVCVAASRSKGYGGLLLEWLCRHAVAQQCRHARLVSGVQRHDAHRFYETNGFVREAYYYSKKLATP